jgi:serine/threonine-protein kinase
MACGGVLACRCAILSPLSPGDLLARRYSLEARLGRGGMGEVWRARKLDTKERVAVKVLNEELAASESSRRRFLREARLASSVRHPNVVEMYDVVEDGDTPFLVMELLAGETLGARLRRKGKLAPAEAAAILLPVLDAVEAAHAAGIVHRDLKPDNIFLAEEPAGGVRVRVLDFGIAKQTEKLAEPMRDEGATTAPVGTTGAMIGTPFYMSPEQALGERDVDARADLWALGVITYECTSGKRPTDATTLGGVLKIIVTDGIAPLADVAPDVDPAVARAVMALLRTDRAARAPSLVALRAALRALEPDAVTLDLPVSDAPTSVRAAPVPPPRGRAWIGGLAAVVGLGALGVVLLRPDAPTASSPAPSSSTLGGATTSTVPTASATASAVPSAAAAPNATASTTDAPSAASAPRGAPTRPIASVRASTSNATAASASAPPAVSRGAGGLVADNPFAGH